jgi:hypothetical protein
MRMDPAMAGARSVSSFATRTRGSRIFAACAYAGAIERHGPHHGAQKSTSTGMSFPSMWVLKRASSSSTGVPAKSFCLQRPQAGASLKRSPGMRFLVPQWGQTTCRDVGVSMIASESACPPAGGQRDVSNMGFARRKLNPAPGGAVSWPLRHVAQG